MDFTETELQRALHLRAIEWNVWPSFLSQLFAPIWFCLGNTLHVIGWIFVMTILWSIIRYRFHSFKMASFAAISVAFAKWPIALGSCTFLAWHHRFGAAAVAMFWPWLCGLIFVPGQVGRCEMNFALEVGYMTRDSM